MSETNDTSKNLFTFNDTPDPEHTTDKFTDWWPGSLEPETPTPAPINHPATYWSQPSVQFKVQKIQAKWVDLTQTVAEYLDRIKESIEKEGVNRKLLWIEQDLRFIAGLPQGSNKLHEYLSESKNEIIRLETKVADAIRRAEAAEDMAVQIKVERDKLQERLNNLE